MVRRLEKMKSIGSIGSSGRLTVDETEEDEASKAAMASYVSRENEIERKKMEMRQKVESRLTRAEEKSKRLSQLWEEIEVFSDPVKKDITTVRKRLDNASRELKSLAQICQKKEKEYKEAMEALQEKNNEKAGLVKTLVELVNQSEDFRMKKLNELSKILN